MSPIASMVESGALTIMVMEYDEGERRSFPFDSKKSLAECQDFKAE
ncbi:MAG: hypothetical protein M2R45_02228 [Verrucomicrobia subdivision 3 bacterium]|nr:hypothetical protein [Limisphaerales bacterium]MCS1413987.1 hypothetical protein [Limisphaerales bacterium]